MIVADDDEGWFYHRAVWIDLTNDGRQSILTARAKRPSILKKGDNVNGNGNGTNNNHSWFCLTRGLRTLLSQLYELKEYCFLNREGFRKILKKFDKTKFFRHSNWCCNWT